MPQTRRRSAGPPAALRLVRAAGERAVGPGGFAVCAVWNALEYIRFGAGLDRAAASAASAGASRAVAAAHCRLDQLETPLD